MKKIIFLILPIILLLNACSSHQNYPVNVTKDKFIDPNPPTINITFPFNIYLNRREVEKEENARIIAYDLYTSSMKEEDVLKRLLGTDGGGLNVDKRGYRIIILKTTLLGNKYFTGEIEDIGNNNIFNHEDGFNFCRVDIKESELQSSLVGNLNKNISPTQANNIIIMKIIGYVASPENWIEENQDQVKDFTDDIKLICDRFLR